MPDTDDSIGRTREGDAREQGGQREINQYFDANSSYWDSVYRDDDLQGRIYKRRQGHVLAAVEAMQPPPARVLEVGCGAGHLTLALARRGLHLDALDASPAMVESARRRIEEAGLGADVEVGQADVHALPFGSGEFDLVVAVGVIPWLHSPDVAVAEMARVLRPGGELVLTADNRARLTSFTDPRRVLALPPLKHAYRRVRRIDPVTVSRLHTPRRVDAMLAHAGLEPIERRTVGFGPLTFMGRSILQGSSGLRLDERLQRLADAGTPGLRWTGWHYLVRARRR
ncbi:MAG TPA: methyltransferase domain-containing protein [Solirubrobacteraceae bacterium]|jgi:ubiquinone/menaquinone biosynthesis C-methylase UbiE|nr:methyltransferase domain-containing protein [Solirubrobacteraceae bacterium]